MDDARYCLLMESQVEPLTLGERAAGWHFCRAWDGLLVGPGMPEFDADRCYFMQHFRSATRIKYQIQARLTTDLGMTELVERYG